MTDEITRLVQDQMSLETNFDTAVTKRKDLRTTKGTTSQLTGAEKDIASAGDDLKANLQMFARGMKQSPLTQDNLTKIQIDR